MTDYKPIMTQETDFYMRALSWRKLVSICFNIISYVFLEMIKRASHELYIWARGSKLVISGSLWIFFFKSEAEPQKKNLIRKFSYD